MRVFRPGFVVFSVALLASLCVHLPVYEVLGGLAKSLLADETVKRSEPVEFELTALDDTTVRPAQAKPEPPADDPAQPPSPSVQLAKVAKPELHEPTKPTKPTKPKPVPNLNVVQPPPPPPTPPPPDVPNKLAVRQKSDDPSVPPPDHADFIAEENRRVDEQSVASVTNLQEDDPDPTPKTTSVAAASDAPGDSDRDDPADLRDVHGDDSRQPNPREAKDKPIAASSPSRGAPNADAVTAAPSAGGATGADQDKRALAAGSAAVGGEEEPLVIDDGMGTLRIRRSLAGHGAGDQGGERQRGAANGQAAQEKGARRGRGASLSLSWSQFERTFGQEDLREQREAYLEQRRSRSRGSSTAAQWKKFRAAIENFVPNVKPGNQTALNAAASPFATYLSDVHRRIHREFAMRFLRDLPLVGGPYNDYSLYTKLEIVINGDGTLYRVGVVQSSGFMPFDYGAWNAVERGAPYPEPPRKILSGDGRVYFRWGFYRNERQCGTFNAEPYILPHIGAPPPSPGPMHDTGDSDDAKFGMRAPLPVRAPAARSTLARTALAHP